MNGFQKRIELYIESKYGKSVASCTICHHEELISKTTCTSTSASFEKREKYIFEHVLDKFIFILLCEDSICDPHQESTVFRNHALLNILYY